MIINYVPGLALRFFPGLSREPYDAVEKYLAANSKIAIFTGTAPTESELWALGNFNDYVTANQDKLVYQETTQLEFSYDGYKHKRVIQRFPIDSTPFNPLIDIIPQDLVTKPDAIPTPNSLYALVYCPDKDTTLNIPGNDLIMLIPEVGSGSSDFCSISNHNFKKDDSLYFRNLTIALFQGYQITDTLITEKQDNPDNPGSQIDVVIDTKKSVYINKNWGNRISEAYRDCFVSRNTFLTKYLNTSGVLTTYRDFDLVSDISSLKYSFYYNDYNLFAGTNSSNMNYMNFKLRKYNKLSSIWENTNLDTQYSTKIYNGFICNESMINLINDINNKALTKAYPSLDTLVGLTLITNSTVRFQQHAAYPAEAKDRHLTANLLPGMLAKHCFNASHLSQDFKDSLTQLLIELGHDEAMINSAFKSLVPIDFDVTKYSSLYNKDTNILTIQNNAPVKLKTRFKNSIHNPTNEKLYIFLPRYIARSGIENGLIVGAGSSYHYSSASSVSYPDTQKVLEGEVVDYNTPRIRQQDFTAISIGKTGNGETDLEFDLIDVIDYIDSFTTMVKIPNKF